MNNLPDIIPPVEFVNGNTGNEERMDPRVMQFVLQAAQLSQAVKMRKMEESKIPIGTKSVKYTVTDEVIELKLSPPWISLTMINDGASDVYISTNEDGQHDLLDQVPVKQNESFELNMFYPTIKVIWLKAADGGSASVRIYAKEGINQYIHS